MYSLYYCSIFTEMYIYCTCSTVMKPVSPICSTIFNDYMNNDTVKLSVACVWVIYSYVSMVFHCTFLF